MVLAAVPRGGLPISRLAGELDHERQWWLVIGDEAGGVPSPITERADRLCSIPTPGRVESLNAAAAGAIICHHLSQLRGNRGRTSDPDGHPTGQEGRDGV